MSAKSNLIQNKTFQFSLDILKLYKHLTERKEFVLAKQIVRSGTSIGANVEEASAALTKKEFISKMSIASKEARETKYWLRLLDASQIIEYNYSLYLRDITDIKNILTAIIKTSQKKDGGESAFKI